jgi:hypothetical protein
VSLGLELNLTNLVHETREITELSTFAVKLGIPFHIIRGSELDFPRNIERQRIGLLSYWLQSNPNGSWKDITSALRSEAISDRISDFGESEESEKERLQREYKSTENDLLQVREQLSLVENLSIFKADEGEAQFRSIEELMKKKTRTH